MSVEIERAVSSRNMLVWADAEERIADVEQRAREVELTLGPLVFWCRDARVIDVCRTRSGWRMNPAMSRIEDVVSAFEYEREGVRARTKSAPREACGPELKQTLYAELDRVRRVELRLLPLSAERWLKLAGQDPSTIHAYVRGLVRDALSPRAMWTELGSAWLCFCGGMRDALFDMAAARARGFGLEAQEAPAPSGPALAPGFVPVLKTWETLGPRDSLVLCDPWAVLTQ